LSHIKAGLTQRITYVIATISFAEIVFIGVVCLSPTFNPFNWIYYSLALLIHFIFIIGCCLYAQSKGYSNALGLLGILGLPGLIALLFIPDKSLEIDKKEGRKKLIWFFSAPALFLVSIPLMLFVLALLLITPRLIRLYESKKELIKADKEYLEVKNKVETQMRNYN